MYLLSSPCGHAAMPPAATLSVSSPDPSETLLATQTHYLF